MSFLIWLFYGLAMVSLIVMRRTKKDVHRPYKVGHVVLGKVADKPLVSQLLMIIAC